jgi:hypothetical protein
MGLAALWETISKTHLVTLAAKKLGFELNRSYERAAVTHSKS